MKNPELHRLGRLVRRIAGPDGVPERGTDVTLADLAWNLTALRYGLQALLPREHPLHAQAKVVEERQTDPRPVWDAVARLPWLTVEQIIETVRKQRGMWELEDFVADADD